MCLFFYQQSIDDSLSKKIEELKMYETKNNTLTFDLNNASGAAVSAEAEISVLNGKLQELEDHLSAVESNSDLEARFQVDHCLLSSTNFACFLLLFFIGLSV